jgi:hypothetical protein
MRQEFCEVKTRKTAIKHMPWASWIVKVCGGYRGFESYSDYHLFVDGKENKKHIVR